MRAKELRDRGEEELMRLLDDARDTLFQSRLKNATHQLDDASLIKKSRREIARINTILTEKANAGVVGEEE